METRISELRELLKKTRRVKTMDIILPDDVNILVDIAGKVVDTLSQLRDLVERELFLSQIYYQSSSLSIPSPLELTQVLPVYHYDVLDSDLICPIEPITTLDIYTG